MFKLLNDMLTRKLSKKAGQPATGPSRNARRVRPRIECLERRDMPSVTFHGGAVLPNVQVQAMFYGSDWATSAYLGQAIQLSSFLGDIVNSSYMDMMTKAGYGVGRGTASPGDVYGVQVNKTQYLTDGQIQQSLRTEIAGGHLQMPYANRLYVVFVEDNVIVQSSNGETSVRDFLGYHSAFQDYIYQDGGLNGISAYFPYDVHYAVVAYTGGVNATRSWLSSAFANMTETASHELADAVTDPNCGYYKTLGWNDDSQPTGEGEIADMSANNTVYLHGYAVQRLCDQHDQPMTPVGATSVRPVNFVLRTDGTFYESTASGLTYISAFANAVASISDQGIDIYGRAVVDVVLTNGYAYEYHDLGGYNLMSANVKQARAGQGVSYLLTTDGNVTEYKEGIGYFQLADANVQSIDAGTDQYGVNMMTEVKTDTFRVVIWVNGLPLYYFRQQQDGYEWSDSTGRHSIASNVKSLSAGQHGIIDYVTTSGAGYFYSESQGAASYLGAGVAAVTAGTDQNGNYMIDLLYSTGMLVEWRQATGWATLTSNVSTIGKAHAGVLDLVMSWGDAWAYDPQGWHYLASCAKTAA